MKNFKKMFNMSALFLNNNVMTNNTVATKMGTLPTVVPSGKSGSDYMKREKFDLKAF